MKDPSYKDESSGRVKHFTFNWVGGGYNDVWAMNKYDAIFVANAWYGGRTSNLKVAEGTVREITGKEKEYYKSLPLWD